MRIKFLLFIICITFSTESYSSNKYDHAYKQKIIKNFDQYVKQTFHDWKIPGLAVAIVDENGTLYINSLGIKQVGTKEKINNHSIFRIASLSKAMTATLIGKFVESNRINWNTPIATILKDFNAERDPHRHKITFKHLLSHSAGFKKDLFSDLVENNFSFPRMQKKLSGQKLVCPVGKCYSYQNFIFSMAGEAISKVTYQHFDKLIEKTLFKPLGMMDTTSGAKPFTISKNRTLPHVGRKNKYSVSTRDLVSNYYNVSPAGGINSSINDMAIWLRAQFGVRPEVISKHLIKTLTTPHVEIKNTRSGVTWRVARVTKMFYGLGWRIYDYANNKLVYHGGNLNGYTNAIAYLPKYKIGIVVLTNSNSPVANLLMAKFMDAYLGLNFIDYNKLEYRRFYKIKKK